MFLLLSGEGSGDIGQCVPAESSSGEDFRPGPMALFVDQLIEQQLGYAFSHIAYQQVGYISEHFLAENKQPSLKKSVSLRGKKKPKETRYYFENARALAVLAKAKSEQLGQPVVAVLFRDADGTASAGRGEWQDKLDSMRNGFASEAFEYGVPMLPKPKSEAWLLCAVKDNPYQHCAALEDGSGNDNSLNPLKAQLADALNGESSTEQLNERVLDGRIDVIQIDMPSFNVFRVRLSECVQRLTGHSDGA